MIYKLLSFSFAALHLLFLMPGLDLVLRLRVVVIEVRLFKVRDVARIPLELIFYPVYLSFVTIFFLLLAFKIFFLPGPPFLCG